MKEKLSACCLLALVLVAGCSVGPPQSKQADIEIFSDCEICPEMVIVPGGSFQMGDLSGSGKAREHPVRTVHIDYKFAVGRYEVTQREWVALMGDNPSYKHVLGGPVDRVNYIMAEDYLQKLTHKTGYRYRLLSEAEWEYAARAGTTANYFWGDHVGSNNAACRGCGGSWDGKIAPVGSFHPNSFGIYDMNGNVAEWVSDCLHYNFEDAPTDGSPWTENGTCSWRIFRGGSMWGYTVDIRSSSRDWYILSGGGTGVGFRVARDINQ